MAVDRVLADRVGALLSGRGAVAKPMFGSLCFMVDDVMCVCVDDGLLCRLEPAEAAAAVAQPGVAAMVMRGRPSRSFVQVAATLLADDRDLASWVGRSVTEVDRLAERSPDR